MLPCWIRQASEYQQPGLMCNLPVYISRPVYQDMGLPEATTGQRDEESDHHRQGACLHHQQLSGNPQRFGPAVLSDPAAPTHIYRGAKFPAPSRDLLLLQAGFQTAALSGNHV